MENVGGWIGLTFAGIVLAVATAIFVRYRTKREDWKDIRTLARLLPESVQEAIWGEEESSKATTRVLTRLKTMQSKPERRMKKSIHATVEYIERLQKDMGRLKSMAMERDRGVGYHEVIGDDDLPRVTFPSDDVNDASELKSIRI